MFCPKCGNPLTGNEEFCPKCGYQRQLKSLKNPKKSSKKKNYLLILLGVLLFLAIVFAIFFFLFKKDDSKNYGTQASSDLVMTSYNENGIPKFIRGNFTNTKVTNEEEALKVLGEISELQIQDATKEFQLDYTETSENFTYYRFDQVYNDLKVYNQNVVLTVDSNGNVSSFSGYYIPNIEVSTSALKTDEEIKNLALGYLGEEGKIESSEKIIYLLEEVPVLAYHIVGISKDKAKEMIWDANTGELIVATDLFDAATPYEYTGMGLNNVTHTITLEEYFDVGFLATEYRFIDPGRDIVVSNCNDLGPVFSIVASIVNNNALYKDPISFRMNENGALTYYDLEFVQNAVSTMAHYEKIYDYYKNVLGRDSYDGKGSTIYVCIGLTSETFSGEDLNNAFWASSPVNRMFIGDYNGKSLSASLDVLGHEFTHGVISKTADFSPIPKDKNKANESAALDEAYADIFGALIEGKNWIVGESNEVAESATRDISNPNKYNYPSKKGGDYYFPDYYAKGSSIKDLLKSNGWETLFDYDRGGEHRNSTVVSHAAYLMYDNGAFKNREEMAKVWYNSLFLLSSYSDFEDCALAVIETAQNLGLSTKSIRIIRDAFLETNMLEEKEYSLEGIIKSGDEILSDVQIFVSYTDEDEVVTTTTSSEEGKFFIPLRSGNYTLNFKKENFEEYNVDIVLDGDVSLNIELARIGSKSESNSNLCQSDNCHNFTIYMYEVDGECIVKKPETFAVDDGTILSMDMFMEGFGITTEGDTMYIQLGAIRIPLEFYYYGTDQKYDWNTPVTSDVAIEMSSMDMTLFNIISGANCPSN